jgi:lipopolysaccharide biosynthesis regulator YciM
MTNKEAIEIINKMLTGYRAYIKHSGTDEDANAHVLAQMQALEIAITALQKQIAVKPHYNCEHIEEFSVELFHCPACNIQIWPSCNHCYDCGQQIDWSE